MSARSRFLRFRFGRDALALGLLVVFSGLLATGLLGASSPNQQIDQQATYEATVRRTDGGIPHVKAHDFASLGFGTGYAMAEDILCLMADQFVTFGAERSRFFGVGASGENLASDFFYQLLIDRGQAEEPVDERQAALFRGAAAGYNRYLRETGVDNLPDATCRGVEWVREIGEIDFRRISRTDFFLPFFLRFIVGNPFAVAAASGPAAPLQLAALEAALPEGKGSNGIGLGGEATAGGRGMLLANPHQPWQGTQRFYAFHQALPGELNVLGANVIGRPQVGFGATQHVAWTSTVSTASRYTLYFMFLLGPDMYFFDGAPRQLTAETVTVMVPDGNGGLEPRSHTFQSTHFGALMAAGTNLAIRTAESGWRGINALLGQYQAESVRELKAVHDQLQFLPVNLIAADASGEALYADPGPIPNLTDLQLTILGCDFGGVFDGTRSACQWGTDPDAAAPGIFGPGNLPHLYRDDFVTNSNDSFWLTNPAEPLTGFNKFLGSVGTERTLRTRSGLQMVQQGLVGGAKLTLEQLQTLALSNQNHTGQLLRDGLVELCEANTMVGSIDVSGACGVLDAWDLKADLDSEGAHLFREFIREGNGGRLLPPTWNYVVPFDVNDPLNTPRGLDPSDNPEALQALATGVERLENAGIALDARLGDVQSVTRQGEVIPLHGGIEASGVFNKIEAAFDADADPAGYREVTGSSSSWIQATEFTEDGPRIRGILTYSLSTNPESVHFSDQTKLFSNKEWLDLPFHEEDVAAAAIETLNLLEGKADCKNGGWQAFTQPSFANQGKCIAHFEELRKARLEEIKARW